MAAMVSRLVRARPLLWCLAILVVAFSLMDWAWSPPIGWYETAVSVLDIALILLLPMFPRTAGILMLALEAVCTIWPAWHGVSRMWGGGLGLGVLAYHRPRYLGMVGLSAFLVLQSIQTYEATETGGLELVGNVAFLMEINIISVAIGYGARWLMTRDRDIVRKASDRAKRHDQEEKARSSEMAVSLHDGLATHFSDIALIAQRHLANGATRSGTDGRDWRTVNDQALQGLEGLHGLIDQLEQGEATPITENGKHQPGLHQRIMHLCSHEERMLKSKGIEGTCRINGSGLIAGAEAMRELLLLALLKEIYRNIGKHCPSGRTFDMTLTLCEDCAEIVAINPVKADDDSLGGRGVLAYQHRLESAGGLLDGHIDSGEWQLYVFLPLTGKA